MSKFRKKFDFAKVKENMEKTEKREKRDYSDSRFWEFKVDPTTHTGSALIRFLPDPETGDAWKKYFRHWFRWMESGQLRFYVKNCASTNGDDCPVCNKVREYYNSPYDADKKLGRERKRGPRFVSNILILRDPACPENEGKVFLFDYGPMIQKMYAEKMFGADNLEDELDDEVAPVFVPCDFDDGADFLYKAIPGEGDIKHTYTPSKFKAQSPLFNELEDGERDAKIDEVMEQAYKLSEFPPADSYPTASEVRNILGAEIGFETGKEESVDEDGAAESYVEDDTPFNAMEDEVESDDGIEEDETPADEEDVDTFIDGL